MIGVPLTNDGYYRVKSDLMSVFVFTNTSILSVFNSFYRLHDPKSRNMVFECFHCF